MGDGAEWIWNLAEQHFPRAVQIVDLYHARQHLWELARRLHPNDEVNQKAWMRVHQRGLLDQGKIEKLVGAFRSIVSTNPELVEKIRIEADYFQRNAARMRYPFGARSTRERAAGRGDPIAVAAKMGEASPDPLRCSSLNAQIVYSTQLDYVANVIETDLKRTESGRI